jgi:class 3 adenylate cyclase
MVESDLKHRLAALLSADVAGYSRLMAEDELATVRTLAICREKIGTLVQEKGGRVVDFVGDNVLVEFPSALDAVACALKIQNTIDNLITGLPDHLTDAISHRDKSWRHTGSRRCHIRRWG